MGYELRYVRPGWKHPRGADGRYIPAAEREYRGAKSPHVQLYETVSEGTPTSPAFRDMDGLIGWMLSDAEPDLFFVRFVADMACEDDWPEHSPARERLMALETAAKARAG